MRALFIAKVILLMTMASLAAPPASAQRFPSHMTKCEKSENFKWLKGTYSVPVVGGGAGIVKVVSEDYLCVNKLTRNRELFQLFGLTDNDDNVVVPFKYAGVYPFSTTGAVVIDHGTGPYPKGLMYRTYIAGKGEGKERFDFQRVDMLQPQASCSATTTDLTTRGVSAVAGEYGFSLGGGKRHVTLFTPDGRARKLEYLGGDDLNPPVRRVGDVLVARWRDQAGAMRSGILGLDGRQISPVLGPVAIWTSVKGGFQPGQACYDLTHDLFVEGPSLDFDPSNPFYGPLLTLIDSEGQPVALPAGAIGMFPANPRPPGASYTHSNPAGMWAVVFPTEVGFEFTLYDGTPSEALIAAPTSPRYDYIGHSGAFGGILGVRLAADLTWRTFRPNTDILLGKPDAYFDRVFANAEAILGAEADQMQAITAAAQAREEASRVARQKQFWETARNSGRLCNFTVSRANSPAEIEEFVLACGPGHQAGLIELARESGISETTLQAAADKEWAAAQEQVRKRAEWDALVARNRNTSPMASYMPGQWESAIRAAGDSVVAGINESSDNWLEERRAQYNSDWQRSQRAY